RSEGGGIATRQRVLVTGGGEDEDVAVVGVLDGAEQLLALLDLQQAMFGDAEGQVDDLAAPDVDGVAQGADDHADVAGALRAKDVGGEKAGARGQGEQNVGNGGAVRAALAALVRQRSRLVLAKDAALDALDGVPLPLVLLLQ